MSEGFAEFSASLFVQQAYGTERFRKFWDDELWFLTQKNRFGSRPVDVGPLTVGARLANTKAGRDTYRLVVCPKGAYVLHMVRMMMWNNREGDRAFKELMRDFVQTYRGQMATTEDFKAMVEKHMTSEMDLDGNRKMDWFFREYVYGTALPRYRYNYSFRPDAKGQVLHIAITGADVGAGFKALVPIYIQLANGKVVRLGMAPMVGTNTLETDVPLAGVKEQPKAVFLNYFYDTLAVIDTGK